MIQQATHSVESQWQKELKQSFTEPTALIDYLQLSTDYFDEDIKARTLFSMRVPKHFAQLMEKGNPKDPLLQQVLPQRYEFIQKYHYSSDPLEEQQGPVPGLLHKYHSRVLLIFKGGCAVNCRYCFRRHFPYAEQQMNSQNLTSAIEYISQHKEINEVIFSGGDPLMANDNAIERVIKQLESITHISRIRFHTRIPVVLSSRINSKLLTILKQTRLTVVMVFHINHANEISDELKKSTQALKQVGAWVLNQSVLLKGINDDIQAQKSLSEALFTAGIQPYYLHLLDKVQGASHFEIDDNQAKALYQQMLAALPGFLVPKLVREIGGEPSKTPILP